MPEAPEVETVRTSLLPRLVRRTFIDVSLSGKTMRTVVPDEAAFRAMLGRAVTGLHRCGKLLIIDAENDTGLFVHLGMSGRILVQSPSEERAAHTHVVFTLDDQSELRFVDPRRFGEVRPFLHRHDREAALHRLGPDPLTFVDADVVSRTIDALGKTTRAIKEVLLDQRIMAGMGNIYVCEALFLAGVHPETPSARLSKARRERVILACFDVIQRGIENGGTTLRDYVDANGQRGRNQNALAVFQREGAPCPTCQRPIRRIVQQARSTFFCPRCQPPWRSRSTR